MYIDQLQHALIQLTNKPWKKDDQAFATRLALKYV